jgi:hypothetical protein
MPLTTLFLLGPQPLNQVRLVPRDFETIVSTQSNKLPLWHKAIPTGPYHILGSCLEVKDVVQYYRELFVGPLS